MHYSEFYFSRASNLCFNPAIQSVTLKLRHQADFRETSENKSGTFENETSLQIVEW